MQRPSLTLILSGIFIGYVIYAIFGIAQLFMPPNCEPNEPCLKSFLTKNSKLQAHMFISSSTKSGQVQNLHVESFDYKKSLSMPVQLELPNQTRQNGTLFLYIIIVPESTKNYGQSFHQLQQNPHMVYTRIKLTQFAVPVAETFNLLGDNNINKNPTIKKNKGKTISHLRSKVTFIIVTDVKELPNKKVPYEIKNSISTTDDGKFLPIVEYDFLQTRLKDLVQIKPDDRFMNLTINYAPITIGHLRLIQQLRGTLEAFKNLGFSDKDVDDIKGIYADTSFYLLTITIFIASIHFLFDFLSFKNDVNFWRKRSTFEGLSVSSIIWRGFSQSVIFLYLLDERSSMLILIPAGVGTLIEMWKIKKVLRIKISRGDGLIPSIKYENKKQNDETQTRKYDAEFMKYLSYLLYPLVIGGAVYSLIYQPHKSWYSWTINSMVNGVYAFGFLFMLPQLFVNYKLKSVAHLPWRSFMYKAFNTFIDDVFAFIITMPTAHRVACFRDDIVFLGYLYQRWLYPVDKSRIDTETIIEEPTTGTITSNKISDKKIN